MIVGINELKTLTKHISCQCKGRFDGKNIIQINYGKTINVDVSVKNICEKEYVWNPSTCSCQNGKYLVSIMDDSVIMCNEIIYTEEKNFNEKNVTSKKKNTNILLPFILTSIRLLIAVSIYCYLIK